MIRRFQVEGYKAFEKFSGTLGKRAYLVGANNAGKSTIIEALIGTARMLSRARMVPPDVARNDRGVGVIACAFNTARVGIIQENLRHEFREERESRVEVTFDGGAKLTAVWPDTGQQNDAPYFYLAVPDAPGLIEPRHVKLAFPSIGLVPLLSPLESAERFVSRETLRAKIDTHSAARHFRNHMYHLRMTGDFRSFTDFLYRWTPEVDMLDLNADPQSGRLDVFYKETGQRTAREISWAGDGLQIWMQMMFHLYRLRDSEVVILDEPDVYLHADLQRRLVRVVETLQAQTIMATHSSEVLAEASSDSLVWVDKARSRAIRGKMIDLDRLAAVLGSQFNLRLAKALRSRVVVFVEGKDMRIMRAMARTIGSHSLAQELGVAVIPLEGYANWNRLEPFAWLSNNLLHKSVRTFAILDRDYRGDAEARTVVKKLDSLGIAGHVWRRKELESYLLESAPLARLTGLDVDMVERWLDEAADRLRGETQAAWVTERLTQSRRGTSAERRIEAEAQFERLWEERSRRIWRVNAKHALARLNDRLSAGGHRTVSAVALARELREDELASEVADVLRGIELEIGTVA